MSELLHLALLLTEVNSDPDTEDEAATSEPEPSSEEESRPARHRTTSRSRPKKNNNRPGGGNREDNDDDGWAALQYQWYGPDDIHEKPSDINGRPLDATELGRLSLKQRAKWSAALEDTFILDTGSTISGTVMNPHFVTNVMPATKPITMSTNAGSKRLTMTGTVPGFGGVYYDPEQVANIFGFSHMTENHRVTFDSKKENAFLVHMPNGIVKFTRTPEGLYAYTPGKKFINRVAKHKNLVPPVIDDRKKRAGTFRDESFPNVAQCHHSDDDSDSDDPDSDDDDDVPGLMPRSHADSDNDSASSDDEPFVPPDLAALYPNF